MIGNTSDWTVISDDWLQVKFWPPLHVCDRIAKLAKAALLCRRPDTDDGFGFIYWRDGSLVRSYSKISYDWGTTYEVFESGNPLPAEIAAVAAVDTSDARLWSIAGSLGYDLTAALGTFRVQKGPRYETANRPFLAQLSRMMYERTSGDRRHVKWRNE